MAESCDTLREMAKAASKLVKADGEFALGFAKHWKTLGIFPGTATVRPSFETHDIVTKVVARIDKAGFGFLKGATIDQSSLLRGGNNNLDYAKRLSDELGDASKRTFPTEADQAQAMGEALIRAAEALEEVAAGAFLRCILRELQEL